MNERTRRLRDRSLAAVGSLLEAGEHGPLLFNPHPWPLQTVVELPTGSGGRTGGQRQPGNELQLVRLPALGCAPARQAACRIEADVAPVRVEARATRIVLDNGLISVQVDQRTDLFTAAIRDHCCAESW